MLLIVGIALIVVGVSDYAIAVVLARSQATGSAGGLGAEPRDPPVSRILKLTGGLTVVAGVVLVAIGLAA